MRKAIRELGLEGSAVLISRAFELNPAAPLETNENGLPTISRRYNMPESHILGQFRQIAELGKAEGLTLNQTDTRHTNTFNAPRLMKMALAQGSGEVAEKLNELLFGGFFVENLNLADWQVLKGTGKKAALEESGIREMPGSEKYAAEVRADEKEAAWRGIHCIPYFLFENGATV